MSHKHRAMLVGHSTIWTLSFSMWEVGTLRREVRIMNRRRNWCWPVHCYRTTPPSVGARLIWIEINWTIKCSNWRSVECWWCLLCLWCGIWWECVESYVYISSDLTCLNHSPHWPLDHHTSIQGIIILHIDIQFTMLPRNSLLAQTEKKQWMF